MKGKVQTKNLKLRVLKSPLKHFQLFSLYNLHGALMTIHSEQAALKCTVQDLGERNYGK